MDFVTDKPTYGRPSVEGNTAPMVRRPQLLDLATRQKPVIQESISQSEQYTKNYQEGFSKLIIYALAGG
jgi:hypothetical protein